MARTKTRYTGVYFRFAQKRIGLDGKPDKCFDIQYKKDGKYIWEKIGWVSEGYTVQDAIEIRGKRIKTIRHPDLDDSSGNGITIKKNAKISKENGITLDDAWDAYKARWLINLKNQKLPCIYQKYWGNNFGDRQILSITSEEIEKLTQSLLERLKPGTTKNILTLFKSIFHKCQEWNIISQDVRCPVKISKFLRIESHRERFLTYKEASIILDALQHINCKVYAVAKISLHTGMRIGEILKLQYHHINLDTGNISIVNGKNGSRTAYISEELKQFITKFLNKKLSSNHTSSYLFVNNKGKNLTVKHVSYVFMTTVNDLGFNDNVIDESYKIVFHTLRHTFCSWLAIQGVPLYTISQLVGHKTPVMTQRYAKLSQDCKRDALKYIDMHTENFQQNKIIENN
jgi:integrase